ncbi:MAG: DNA-binding response regulator [Chloroflexi bacterium]|nr:MAG: DNA-binding response regulator [Chloroflexota bacterium]MBL1194557.1 DNA-binding response regulator [Chloroflexota bacterium]NOH11845.1 response regulator transcription factor [Chloroflexota bacterium]
MNTKTASGGILVVDDEVTIREVVRRYLERDGFSVREAADGYEVLDQIEEREPELIVLDLMLPGIDGLTLCRQIRQKHRIPIIMLTAKGEAVDRIRGLDLGADDYVVKPFNPQELVSRVNAVLRRVQEPAFPEGDPIEFEGLKIDPAARMLYVDGKGVAVTAKEFDLLWLFTSHPGRVFTREQLLDKVWGEGYYGDPSTVTVHIRRLREKIEKDASTPKYLVTVWGVGYKFEG